jgi:hypothetical protein
VEFVPREGRRLVASGAELEPCDIACNFTQFAVTVKLATDHIGKGCDRDTYSLQSQRKLCGNSVYFRMYVYRSVSQFIKNYSLTTGIKVGNSNEAKWYANVGTGKKIGF